MKPLEVKTRIHDEGQECGVVMTADDAAKRDLQTWRMLTPEEKAKSTDKPERRDGKRIIESESYEPFPIKPPEQPCLPPWVTYLGDNAILSPPECEEIIKIGKTLDLRHGGVGNATSNSFREDLEYRSAEQGTIWPAESRMWLFKKLRDRISWANRDWFRFDLTGFSEGLIFLKYTADDVPGHYRWHQDFGGGYSANRKLTLVVQLSDSRDYNGCDLSVFTSGEQASPAREQGEGVLFPAWTPHMVSPIEGGTRYALVVWVAGPQFR